MKEEVILEYLTHNSQSDQSEGCSQKEQATDCSRLLRKPPRFQGFALDFLSFLSCRRLHIKSLCYHF
ncbi:unnamed protein product [Brassica oleracea var. botrytis]